MGPSLRGGAAHFSHIHLICWKAYNLLIKMVVFDGGVVNEEEKFYDDREMM